MGSGCGAIGSEELSTSNLINGHNRCELGFVDAEKGDRSVGEERPKINFDREGKRWMLVDSIQMMQTQQNLARMQSLKGQEFDIGWKGLMNGMESRRERIEPVGWRRSNIREKDLGRIVE